MRYYDLIIHPNPQFTFQKISGQKQSNSTSTSKTTGNVTNITTVGKRKLQFSSYLKKSTSGLGYEPGGSPISGVFDPGALDIEFEIDQVNASTFTGAAIKIKGLDITTLGQAANLQGRYVRLSAGMGKGLPLSKPYQAGLILQGQIYSSFGNWEDTDMSLTLYVLPFIPPEKPLKFCLTGDRGTPLLNTIKSAISDNFPLYIVNILTDKNPLLPEDARGTYETLDSFTTAMVKKWKELTGVDLYIYSHGQQFYIADQTNKSTTKQIEFTDLIGQPTWNGPASISFCTPIRYDLKTGDTVKFWIDKNNNPKLLYGNISATAASVPLPKNRSLFNGEFFIRGIHHLGQFRSADGRQWMSIFDAIPKNANK